MTSNVVTDAGPLMVFSKLNVLHLLKQLYQRVLIPLAVYNETVEKGMQRGFEDARILRLFLQYNQWEPIEVHNIPATIHSATLDQGEKEAIALALSQNVMLLIDEERGREIARQHGLTVHGSLGVFIEAYRKHVMSFEQLRFYFTEINSRPDIWISPTLCRRLLQQLESP